MKNIVFKEINDLERDYVIVRRSLLLSLLCDSGSDLKSLEDLMPDDSALHLKIRTARKANKFSQFQLAEHSKLKQPDISSFEKGDDGFSSERRMRIINALKELLLEKNS